MSPTPINPNLVDGSDTLIARPNIANFKPSPWTDRFIDYTPDIKAIEALQEQAKELKEELNKEMQSIANKPLLQQLCFIDIVERLGVAYHFEKEIEDALQRIHETNPSPSDTLFLTSLRFRLLRQHGLNASSDVFKGFISSDGSLKEAVTNDVQGILSLYEACHVRGHEDGILDEALPVAISILKSIQDQPSHPLKEQASYALHKPLHRWPTRLESLHHMRVYKQDPSHHKTLLRFAMVDFNFLQSVHKKEVSELCRWWKAIGVTSKLPLRDRLVETYLWASFVFHEPQYANGRKFITTGIQSVTTVDDLYDAYGTPEELEIFTEAVRRWDKSCLDQLPENLRMFYQLVLDVSDEMESDLEAKGRSQYIHYEKEEMKLQCEAYHIEAKWRGHTALSIECHMKHYGVSYEQACKELYEKTEELWKDMNQAILEPREVPLPLLKRILTMAHAVTFFFDGGRDGYTSVGPALMESVKSLFVDPLSIDED